MRHRMTIEESPGRPACGETASLAPTSPFDTTRRYVRVTGERANGFVEFHFAVGEPDLFVEMILSREAYVEFCAANRVEVIPAAPDEAQEADAAQGADEWGWRLADATRIRFR